MILQWLRSLRQQHPTMSSAGIRRHIADRRQQRDQRAATRDALALDAMRSDSAAEQYQRLDAEVAELAQQVQMLEAALPRAEQQEAEAARQADAKARTKRMQDYQCQTAEAKRWADALIARLTTGEELTQARTLRDALREEARALSRWSDDVTVRRPLNPLEAIHDALALRVQRIERSRWIGSHPITLDDKRAAS